MSAFVVKVFGIAGDRCYTSWLTHESQWPFCGTATSSRNKSVTAGGGRIEFHKNANISVLGEDI